MRKRHWFSGFVGSALCAAMPSLAGAQSPDAMGGGYAPPPAYGAAFDPSVPAGGAAYAPPPGGVGPAGWPPGATQWPYVSPYMAPPVDQHSYQNGFWFNEQMRGGRKYYTSMYGTLNEYADPDDVVVGDPKAPGFYVPPTETNGNDDDVLVPVFEAKRWDDVEDKLSGGGFRAMTGFFNPDDTGWFLEGFWAEEGGASYSAMDEVGDPLRPVDTLRARAGIPLFDGGDPTTLPPVPPDTTGVVVDGGGTQPYDMYYRLGWQSQSYGAGIGYYSNALYSSESLKVRPMWGMRYLNIRENATFEGADSGLAYEIDTSTGAPVEGTITGIPDVFESELRSNTKAHLGGPEIGLRLDLGDEKFKIWLQSKLGVLANHSTREIDGFGIGRSLGQTIPTPNDPTITAFHQQETTTSVSPTFEQSIFMRAPLLQFVPGVRKLKLFEDAQFQLGYTWLVAGGVYRPGNVIDWQGYPNFPELNSEKTTWFMSSVNIGVEWNY